MTAGTQFLSNHYSNEGQFLDGLEIIGFVIAVSIQL